MLKIRSSLRRESITVWTNKTDIQTGEAFEEAITRGIEQADNVVYLLSPDSINSDFCQRELDLAVSLHKRIIPLLVRETDPMQMSSALRSLQYIDLTDNVKAEDYQLDESQLLKILHEDAAYYNEHKVLLTKALKWKRQHCNPSILLRGYNLRHAEAWLKVAKQRTQHPPTPLQEEFITESLRQPPAESLDVFISYSRADADFARKLNDALQIQGKTTWFDQESIASGTDFQQEINRGIKACDNFLFILSPRSVNSPFCAGEVEYAASLNKRFVTVLHREVNSADLHPELAKVQWIDFNQNERDFNANFNQLVRTLDTDREHVQSHTKWLQRAIEWEHKGKSVDLLLRGNEYVIAQNWLQEAEQKKKRPSATPLQQEFILESGEAINSTLKREKLRVVILRSLLGVMSAGFVVAVAVGTFAFSQWRRAELVQESQIKAVSRISLVLSEADEKFDALIEAIRAGRQLQKQRYPVDREAQSLVLTALQTSVYGRGFRERNQTVGDDHTVQSVVWSPDGKIIASAGGNSTIKLWSLGGKRLRVLSGHTNQVNSVAWSPDGKMIASASGDDTASEDNTVKLWSIDGKLLHTLKGHKNLVKSVRFSPDGKMIASASWDKTVILWNRDKGLRSLTLTGHSGYINSVNFSPDSKMIATASVDSTVKLWSVDGKELKTLKEHKSKVHSVVWSPDGQTIATASNDNTVKLWSVDGKELKTLKGHTDGVISVVFSPDGKTLASSSQDKTIRLWNVEGEQWKPLQTLKGHTDGVTSVVFSPDGKTLASVSNDNSVILWNLEDLRLDKLMQDACDWVGDYLKYNSEVEEGDRYLCDGIGSHK